MDARRAYRVLGLVPGATIEEVRTAWRDLAQVWHPDRFPEGARLRAKAEENLKRINAAWEVLKDFDPAALPRPSLARRMRESVTDLVGLGDLRLSSAAHPSVSWQRHRTIVGLGIRRSEAHRRRRKPWLPSPLVGLAILAAAALLLALLLR